MTFFHSDKFISGSTQNSVHYSKGEFDNLSNILLTITFFHSTDYFWNETEEFAMSPEASENKFETQ